MKAKLILGGLAAIVVILSEVWLIAAPQAPEQHQSTSPQDRQAIAAHSSATTATSITPTVGTPNATPSLIIVNTPTIVTVTVQINPTPLPGGVNLLQLGATGTQPTILGVMRDDGKNGDAVPNDGVYTLQLSLNEHAAGQIGLQVSAAFSGSLKRITSSAISIAVWSSYVDSQTKIQLSYPPELHPVTGSYVAAFALQSSTSTLSWSGAVPDSGGPYSDTGFVVIVSTQPYTGVFDLQSWISQSFPPGDVSDTLDFGPVSGVPAYALQFFGDTGDGGPSILVPKNGTLYTFSYRSSNLTQAEEDSDVNEFEDIVQSVVLP